MQVVVIGLGGARAVECTEAEVARAVLAVIPDNSRANRRRVRQFARLLANQSQSPWLFEHATVLGVSWEWPAA
jgi:hypothetical protein